MLKILKEADAPDIRFMDLKLLSTNTTLNDKLSRLSLKDRCIFDLDLAMESGAKRFVEVAEHGEQMCKELVPDRNYYSVASIFRSQIFAKPASVFIP